jgi:hypothetical protein
MITGNGRDPATGKERINTNNSFSDPSRRGSVVTKNITNNQIKTRDSKARHEDR